jgi:hypothetical protein
MKYFEEWLHVISEPVVVRVDVGATPEQRQQAKRSICLDLRRNHLLSLTVNMDDLVLSKSQMNMPLEAMVDALRACGYKECRVGFYGMKWAYPKAQPRIDRCVELHFPLRGVLATVKRNQFDVGITLRTTAVDIFHFSERQIFPHRVFRQGKVYDMFNIVGFGALEFKVPSHEGLEHVKLYQEVTHAVLSGVQKSTLDDMPKSVRTLKSRSEQLTNLLRTWGRYGRDELQEYLCGTRIEITVIGVDTVEEAYDFCSDRGLLSMHGIERMLGGPFEVQSIPLHELLGNAQSKVQELDTQARGRNESRPSIRLRCALTEARQSVGWSGKNMAKHLREARNWNQASTSNGGERNNISFEYDGWEQDAAVMRPIIQDFITHAHWQNHSATAPQNHDPHPIYLRKTHGNFFWKQRDVYVDRVGAARHFVDLYGDRWRRFVKAQE